MTINYNENNISAMGKPITTASHVYKTGAHYEGEWKGGLRHGQGVMTWVDGAKYKGTWQYNQCEG